jgi:hypothetical protein
LERCEGKIRKWKSRLEEVVGGNLLEDEENRTTSLREFEVDYLWVLIVSRSSYVTSHTLSRLSDRPSSSFRRSPGCSTSSRDDTHETRDEGDEDVQRCSFSVLMLLQLYSLLPSE